MNKKYEKDLAYFFDKINLHAGHNCLRYNERIHRMAKYQNDAAHKSVHILDFCHLFIISAKAQVCITITDISCPHKILREIIYTYGVSMT